MPVRDVLRTHTAQDIAGWMAYERAFGDIGGIWQMECLAEIHELLQNILYMTGAQAENNPAPRPVAKDRPMMLQPSEDDEIQAEEESGIIPDEIWNEHFEEG